MFCQGKRRALLRRGAERIGTGPPGKKSFQILIGDARDIVKRFFGQKALVRGDDDIRMRSKQRQYGVSVDLCAFVLVKDAFFFLVHVQSGAPNAPCPQGVEQRLTVNQLAARGIDDKNAVLHPGKRCGV